MNPQLFDPLDIIFLQVMGVMFVIFGAIWVWYDVVKPRPRNRRLSRPVEDTRSSIVQFRNIHRNR